MRRAFASLLATIPVLLPVLSPTAAAEAATTRLSLVNGQWHINDRPTHPGIAAQGLLLNVRMVNAVFEDRRKPDFDPEANTDRFIARLPDYAAHGVNAFTLCLQGGMPGYEGAVNSAFEPDGTLRPAYLARVERVIRACDRHGLGIILGLFYQRQSAILRDEAAVRAGVVNAARWVRERGFQNVLLEIANEYPHNGFVHQVIRDPKGQAGLIRLAKETAPGLLVSASGYGDGRIHREVAEAADFLLPHWNGTKVEHIPARIAALKPFGKPIVCNEDDKTGAEAVAALRACVDHGASYGLMLKARNQTFPFRFDGAADDPVFYAGLSGLVARPERPGAGGAVLPGRSGDAAGAKEPGRPASGSVHRKTLPVGTRPESVTKGFGGHYYVTVMGGQQPGDAVIKVIKGDQVEVFATGLDEPKGIAFVGGFLVTTDLKRVWKIDARGNKTVLADEKDFPKPISYLNDAAAAPDGQGVFVTDMGARDKIMGPDGLWPTDSPEAKAVPAIGRVYHLSLDGRVRLAVDAAPAMTCPNGVCAPAPDHLLIAEFFHGNLLQARHGSVQVLNTGFRGADGIERAKSGRIFVSSWTQGKVWRLDEQGQNPEVLIEGLQSAADFYLDEPARLLLVPDMKAGLVVWVPLE